MTTSWSFLTTAAGWQDGKQPSKDDVQHSWLELAQSLAGVFDGMDDCVSPCGLAVCGVVGCIAVSTSSIACTGVLQCPQLVVHTRMVALTATAFLRLSACCSSTCYRWVVSAGWLWLSR